MGIDRSHESVTTAGECFDEVGNVGGIAEGRAEFVDGEIDGVVEIPKALLRPDEFVEFLSCDDLAGML